MELSDKLIRTLLTSTEKKVLQKRYKIIDMLKTDLTYREIAKKMGISTTTVVRLNQRLQIRKQKKKKTLVMKHKKQAGAKFINEEKSKLPWVIG